MDVWCEALGQVDPERIRAALSNVATTHPEWPPTLGEFLALCKPPTVTAAHRLLLPSPRGPRPPIDPLVKAKIDATLRAMRERGTAPAANEDAA